MTLWRDKDPAIAQFLDTKEPTRLARDGETLVAAMFIQGG